MKTELLDKLDGVLRNHVEEHHSTEDFTAAMTNIGVFSSAAVSAMICTLMKDKENRRQTCEMFLETLKLAIHRGIEVAEKLEGGEKKSGRTRW